MVIRKSVFCWAVSGVAATVAAVAWAEAQIPPGFEIVQITSDPDYDGPPKINNCGEIVFSKRINQADDGEEIFLYDNGPLTRLTDDNVRDAFPDINDPGTIVWAHHSGNYGENEIAMRLATGALSIVGPGSSPEINNLGHVAWKLLDPTGCATRSDIFLYDGDAIDQITSDRFSNQTVEINDSDELVWTRYDFCASPWESGIMRYSDGVISQLTDEQRSPQRSAINDVGQILWHLRDADNEHFIELWENGVTVTLTDDGAGPAPNNLGDVAFTRVDPSGVTSQLWLYRDGEFTQVTDTPVWNISADMNDVGEIAWVTGIYPDADIRLLRRVRTGDGDFDGDIDMDDFTALAGCMTGPVETDRLCECRFFDLDHDRDVDVDDYLILETNFTGPE